MLRLRPRYVGLAAGLVLAAGIAILYGVREATPASEAVPPVPAARQTWAPQPATRAAGLDQTKTASIGVSAPDDPAMGTAAFRGALEVLAAGDPAAAYDLGSGLGDGLERRTLQWAAIYFGSGRVPYQAVLAFEDEAPDFVVPTVFKTRIEQALTRSKAPGTEIIKLLGGTMPNTLDARIALAQAYLRDNQTARARRIARAIWTEEFLSPADESKVLAALGGLLDRDAHWARAVHLMMNDRAAGVERLLKYLTPAQKSLAAARIAVSRRDKDAKSLLDRVDPSMTGHPVYIFSRAQRARQAGLLASAIDWLDKARGELPDAAEWWKERQALVRQLLAAGKPALAYRAAEGYRSGPEGRLVEARFQAGWIALAFLKDAETARAHFEAMRSLATLPDTVAQANYWLGRALKKLGDDNAARRAFGIAAGHGTLYYGILARYELGLAGVELRPLPGWREREPAFDARQLVRAIRLLAANGRADMAEPLLKALAASLTEGADLVLAAQLAQSINAHHLAISIADTAEQRGYPLDLFSFPKDGLPSIQPAGIDLAAIYAVTRQESRFQPDAVSTSGALGLMQLMPATAKETAAKMGLAYSKARLTTDPEYNTLLGATYLATQLERFGGSLLLAAAAYNAGAGNAADWIAAFGDPREDGVDPVVWVELVPLQETRNYVQRVIGNYLVYRARLGDSALSIREALRRLPG